MRVYAYNRVFACEMVRAMGLVPVASSVRRLELHEETTVLVEGPTAAEKKKLGKTGG